MYLDRLNKYSNLWRRLTLQAIHAGADDRKYDGKLCSRSRCLNAWESIFIHINGVEDILGGLHLEDSRFESWILGLVVLVLARWQYGRAAL